MLLPLPWKVGGRTVRIGGDGVYGRLHMCVCPQTCLLFKPGSGQDPSTQSWKQIKMGETNSPAHRLPTKQKPVLSGGLRGVLYASTLRRKSEFSLDIGSSVWVTNRGFQSWYGMICSTSLFPLPSQFIFRFAFRCPFYSLFTFRLLCIPVQAIIYSSEGRKSANPPPPPLGVG